MHADRPTGVDPREAATSPGARRLHRRRPIGVKQGARRKSRGLVRFSKALNSEGGQPCRFTAVQNHKFLILLDDDYEDLEFWYPKLRLIEAGAEVVVAGPPGKHHFHGKHGYPATSDAEIPSMKAVQFQGVIIPGGWAPDKLRRDPHVLDLVRDFNDAGKMIALYAMAAGFPSRPACTRAFG